MLQNTFTILFNDVALFTNSVAKADEIFFIFWNDLFPKGK